MRFLSENLFRDWGNICHVMSMSILSEKSYMKSQGDLLKRYFCHVRAMRVLSKTLYGSLLV